MIKKRLNFVSNSSSQSFIINSKVATIDEIKEYIYDVLKSSKCYSLKVIKENVDVCYYKNILNLEDGEYIKDSIDSWYSEFKKTKIKDNDIIVFISDNFWPCDFDNDETGWFKLSPLLKKFKITNRKWSMHMG